MAIIMADNGGAHHAVLAEGASNDVVKKIKQQAQYNQNNLVGAIESFTLARGNVHYSPTIGGYVPKFNLRAMPQNGGSNRITRNKFRGHVSNMVQGGYTIKSSDPDFYKVASILGINHGDTRGLSKIVVTPENEKAVLYNVRGNPTRVLALNNRDTKSLEKIAEEENSKSFFNLRAEAGPAKYKSEQSDADAMVYVADLLLNLGNKFAIRAEHNTFSIDKTLKATGQEQHLDANVERVGMVLKPLGFLTVDLGYNYTDDIDHIRPQITEDRGKKSAQGIRTEWGLIIPGKNTVLVSLDYFKTRDSELYRTMTAGLLHEFNGDKTYMMVRYQNVKDTYLNQQLNSVMGWLHHRFGKALEAEVGGSVGDQKSVFGSVTVYPVNGVGFLVSAKRYQDPNLKLDTIQGGLKIKF